MYDRYRVQKRNRPILIFLMVILLLGGLVFAGYRYRQHLMFWTYTSSALKSEVDEIRALSGRARMDKLEELKQMVSSYSQDNPLTREAWLNSGMYHYLMADTLMEDTFTVSVIHERWMDIKKPAREQFLESIRCFAKGLALDEDRSPENEIIFPLARALLHTGYYPVPDIVDIYFRWINLKTIDKIEHHRLYAVLMVLSGEEEAGLEYLISRGEVRESLQGRLLMARVQEMARHFTDAINTYQRLAGEVDDPSLKVHIYFNLGKIYHKRSLYRESLENLRMGLEIEPAHRGLRVWTIKSLEASGRKGEARERLDELLKEYPDDPRLRELMETI